MLPGRNLLRLVLGWGVVAILYTITGKLGFSLAIAPGNVTTVWPPSGIALAAIMLGGYGLWPGIWFGSLAVNLWFFAEMGPLAFRPFAAALGIATGSTLQAILGAFLIQHFTRTRNPFDDPRNVFKFTSIETAICLVGPTAGVLSLCLAGFVSWTEFIYTWWTFWLGDLVGVVVLTPLLVTWRWEPSELWKSLGRRESLFFILLLVTTCEFVFGTLFPMSDYPLTYLLIPFIGWAAFLFGQLGVVLTSLAISLSAIWATVNHVGPFVRDSINESLLLLQSFVGVVTVTGLALAAVVMQRRRAQEEIKRYAEELERSNAELERFAFVSSHDLREPLRKIVSFGDLLELTEDPRLSDKGRDYLQRIQRTARHMQRLIEDLLVYSKIAKTPPKFETVELGGVVRSVLSDLETTIKESGASIEVAKLPTISAEEFQMHQLFQNLITNALKFHKQGEAPRVVIETGALTGHMAEVIVRDNGIGFDEKYLDRIFQPFQRLHGSKEFDGTGIGLSICQKVALRHGGSITAKSVSGKGSSFIVTLPLGASQGGDKDGS